MPVFTLRTGVGKEGVASEELADESVRSLLSPRIFRGIFDVFIEDEFFILGRKRNVDFDVLDPVSFLPAAHPSRQSEKYLFVDAGFVIVEMFMLLPVVRANQVPFRNRATALNILWF